MPSSVEGQCLDAHQTHGISMVGPSVAPCSMASSVLTASSSAYWWLTFASSVPSAIAANTSCAVPFRFERKATSCMVEGQAYRRSVATGRHSALRNVAVSAMVEQTRCQVAAGTDSMIETVRQVRLSGPSHPNRARMPGRVREGLPLVLRYYQCPETPRVSLAGPPTERASDAAHQEQAAVRAEANCNRRVKTYDRQSV